METDKIKVNIKAEIHFYPVRAAVLLENNSDEKDKKFGEILLFSLYALRTGVNLRKTELLGDLLKSSLEDISTGNSYQNSKNPYNFKPEEGEGEKIFRVPLVFNESTGEFYFTIKLKGFGFLNLGGDIIVRAPESVLILFNYLYHTRKDDKDYIEKLIKTALLCAMVLENRWVNIFNQHETALGIALLVFKEDTNK